MGTLLRCGALAGPLYLTVGFAQAFTREGFDIRVHALSNLSNGDAGWIQVLNFLICGGLVLAGATGIRRALQGTPGGVWIPALLGVYGVGLIGAGIFAADPAPGFPPGTVPPESLTREGMLHFAFGGIGFYALIGACLVSARRFVHTGERAWATTSAGIGTFFFISFAAIASGSTAPAAMLSLYAAVSLAWIWHCALHLKLLREPVPGPVRAAVAAEPG